MDRSIADDVAINRFKLEEESEEHSSLYWYWSEQSTEARKERDIAKAKYKEIVAKIEIDYRADRLEMDCKKTESSISSHVEIHPEVKQYKQALIDAEYKLGKAESAEESMRQRKSMLNNLIQLYTMQYYSAPGSKTDNREADAGEDYRKQMNDKRKNKGE